MADKRTVRDCSGGTRAACRVGCDRSSRHCVWVCVWGLREPIVEKCFNPPKECDQSSLWSLCVCASALGACASLADIAVLAVWRMSRCVPQKQ